MDRHVPSPPSKRIDRHGSKDTHKEAADHVPNRTSPTSSPPVCEAKPTSPPQSAGVRGSYQCIVDYHRQAFAVTWSGPPEYPDLAGFPYLKNVDVSSVHLNPEMAAIWGGSTILEYGSHASIRLAALDPFPILKLAHADELSMKLIQHEFDVLAELTKLGLPVSEFGQRPILDDGVMCGYRMKRLSKLEPSEFRSRTDEIKHTLDQLHSAGFCHGDFSPSNGKGQRWPHRLDRL